MQKKEKATTAIYAKLNSTLDLARSLCDFTGAVRSMAALREGKSYRLFSTGEKLGSIRMIYYCTAEKIGRFCVYAPGDIQQKEHLEMRDTIGETQSFGSYNIPVIELENNPYKEKAAPKLEVRL